MKVFLAVLASALALAASSPTLGLLSGLGHGSTGGVLSHGTGASGTLESGVAGVSGQGLGGLLGNLVSGGGIADRGLGARGYVYPVYGGGLTGVLGFLGQALSDVTGNAGSILNDLVHLRVPGLLDDVFNAVISLGRGVGGIVNALIPGLGDILGNLVVSLGKILLCVLGSPGLTGSLLGRTPGKDNTVDIPYICRRDFGSKYGLKPYTGDYSSPQSVIDFYNLRGVKKQVLQILNKVSGGKGLAGLSGAKRVIFKNILDLTDLIERDSSSWSKKDAKVVYKKILILLATLGDSYQKGYGKKLVRDFKLLLKTKAKGNSLGLSTEDDDSDISDSLRDVQQDDSIGNIFKQTNGNSGDNQGNDNSGDNQGQDNSGDNQDDDNSGDDQDYDNSGDDQGDDNQGQDNSDNNGNNNGQQNGSSNVNSQSGNGFNSGSSVEGSLGGAFNYNKSNNKNYGEESNVHHSGHKKAC